MALNPGHKGEMAQQHERPGRSYLSLISLPRFIPCLWGSRHRCEKAAEGRWDRGYPQVAGAHVMILLTFSESRDIFPASWFLINIQEAYL